MSDIIISGPAKLWIAPIGADSPSGDQSFEDAGWQSVDDWFDGTLHQFYECEDASPKREFIFEPITLTAKFTPSPEFMSFLAGMQLQYSLRELHRNLGRYARWPYTN